MHRRASKRKELIIRIATYAAMTTLVLTIVTVLVMVTLDYKFDAGNGRVEQAALLQYASIPNSADVSVDGAKLNARTPTKSSVLEGRHVFSMQLNGYETWQKTLDVKAGTLTWLNHARLVPKTRAVEAVKQYASIYASLASPAGYDSLLVQENSAVPSFRLLNLQGDNVTDNILSIPASVYSDSQTPSVVHSYTLDQWDDGGRYVLIKHAYGSKTEWLVMDTRDAGATKNITRTLDFDITAAKFAGMSGNVLFALSTNGDVRKLDLVAGTISRTLISKVTSFDLFETGVITYVGSDTTDSTKRVVGVYRDGDASAHVLRTVAGSAPLKIATGRYFNQDYVAIAEGSKVDILYGSYPSGSDISSLALYETFKLVGDVDQLTFSPKGDFVLAQSGVNFAGYDIEHKALSTTVIAKNVTATVGALKWLDESHLWSDYNGDVTMREFDGQNGITINTAVVGQDVTITKNGRYLYSIGKSGNVYQVQRVRMILQ